MSFIKPLALLLFLISFGHNCFASEYIIFSVSQQLHMGDQDQKLRKNYYVNLGSDQGLEEGTKLSVYRVISKYNPYDDSKRVNYKVKIGTLSVLHTEKESAITELNTIKDNLNDPVLDIEHFMIGDHVTISIE